MDALHRRSDGPAVNTKQDEIGRLLGGLDSLKCRFEEAEDEEAMSQRRMQRQPSAELQARLQEQQEAARSARLVHYDHLRKILSLSFSADPSSASDERMAKLQQHNEMIVEALQQHSDALRNDTSAAVRAALDALDKSEDLVPARRSLGKLAELPRSLELWKGRQFRSFKDYTHCRALPLQAQGDAEPSALNSGRVWLVRSPLGRDCVLKRYEAEHEKAFTREVNILYTHLRRYQQVVDIEGFFVDDDQLYLQMPHYAAGTLEQALQPQPTDTPLVLLERRLVLFHGVAMVLARLHGEGISHRDLKPSNVFINDRGQPVLADFEISRESTRPGTTTRFAGAVRWQGTPPWIPPEGLREERATDVKDVWVADVFALGVMLAESLLDIDLRGSTGLDSPVYGQRISGRVPEVEQAARWIVRSSSAPPQDALVELIHRMLETEPGDRPSMWEVTQEPAAFRGRSQAELAHSDRLRDINMDAARSAFRRARSSACRIVPPAPNRLPRAGLLHALIPVVNAMNAATIAADWRVRFEGEDAIDEGGVHRELLSAACDAFHERCVEPGDQDWALKAPGGDLPAEELEAAAECLGRLIAHSLAREWPLPLGFSPAVYWAVLRPEELFVEELGRRTLAWWEAERGWGNWGQSRAQLHKRWLDDIDKDRWGSYSQAAEADETFEGLCAEGASVPVTQENAKWWSLLKSHRLLFGDGRDKALAAIRTGMQVVDVGKDSDHIMTTFSALHAMQISQVMAYVQGQQSLYPEMLLEAMVCISAQQKDEEWLQAAVRTMSPAELVMLLRFATGSSRMQHGGKLACCRNGTRCKITVQFFDHITMDHLPQSHTCDYTVDMPHYPDFVSLREKLIDAIYQNGGGMVD
eukprot:gene2769-3550_t